MSRGQGRTLFTVAIVTYVAAWLLPAAEGADSLIDGVLPGWEAVRFAAGYDDYADNAILNVLVRATAWTNLIFVGVIAFVSFDRRHMRHSLLLCVLLIVCTILNAHWIIIAAADADGGGVDALRAGYWLWLGAFVALSTAAVLRAGQQADDAPSRAQTRDATA